MNIRLYHENDSRPVGDYDYCRIASVTPTHIFLVTQTGVRIVSNLKFKITLEPNEAIAEHGTEPGLISIVGEAKPPKIKVAKQNVNSTKQQLNIADTIEKSRISKAVPRTSEYPSNDSDEINRVGTRGTGGSARNGGKQSGTLPFTSGGEDENW